MGPTACVTRDLRHVHHPGDDGFHLDNRWRGDGQSDSPWRGGNRRRHGTNHLLGLWDFDHKDWRWLGR